MTIIGICTEGRYIKKVYLSMKHWCTIGQLSYLVTLLMKLNNEHQSEGVGVLFVVHSPHQTMMYKCKQLYTI